MTSTRLLYISVCFLLSISTLTGQSATASFSAEIKIDNDQKENFTKDGRLYVFLSKNMRAEPRTQTWPSPAQKTYIFAKNMTNADVEKGITVKDDRTWVTTAPWTLSSVPAGDYNFQVLWDQDQAESRIDAPGNLYSNKKVISVKGEFSADVLVSEMIGPREITEHALDREVDMKSALLSEFWGEQRNLKASILLPEIMMSPKLMRYDIMWLATVEDTRELITWLGTKSLCLGGNPMKLQR